MCPQSFQDNKKTKRVRKQTKQNEMMTASRTTVSLLTGIHFRWFYVCTFDGFTFDRFAFDCFVYDDDFRSFLFYFYWFTLFGQQ